MFQDLCFGCSCEIKFCHHAESVIYPASLAKNPYLCKARCLCIVL